MYKFQFHLKFKRWGKGKGGSLLMQKNMLIVLFHEVKSSEYLFYYFFTLQNFQFCSSLSKFLFSPLFSITTLPNFDERKDHCWFIGHPMTNSACVMVDSSLSNSSMNNKSQKEKRFLTLELVFYLLVVF